MDVFSMVVIVTSSNTAFLYLPRTGVGAWQGVIPIIKINDGIVLCCSIRSLEIIFQFETD